MENLRQRQWKQPPEPFRGPTMRLTLLHLATALGYSRLITALICFKTDNPSLIMDYEVDSLSIDDRACNPLVSIERIFNQWRIEDFPLGGRRPPTRALFGENVCENERIGSHWGGGGACRWRPPDPPMLTCLFHATLNALMFEIHYKINEPNNLSIFVDVGMCTR